jgi:hypothetical protein
MILAMKSCFVLQAYISALLSSTNHFTLKMERARSSKTMVSYRSTAWHHNPKNLKQKIRLLKLLCTTIMRIEKFMIFTHEGNTPL